MHDHNTLRIIRVEIKQSKIMNFLIILAAVVTAAAAKRVICHACLNQICHRKVTVFEARQFSGQLALDKASNILYFHYKTRSKDLTGQFDLDDIKFNILPNITFSFGHAVDQDTRELYMSGDRGIYKYNPFKNRTELYGLADKTVWHLQYHKTLYYSQFKKKGLSTFSNKKISEPIPPLSDYVIDDFIVDKLGDIYFLSNEVTYFLKNGAKKADIFEDEIYFLSTDYNDDAYFIQPFTRAIYKIDYSTRRLEEVGAVEGGSIVKVVFDVNNNMVYHDAIEQKLFYLMPNFNKCNVVTRGAGRQKSVRLVLE